VYIGLCTLVCVHWSVFIGLCTMVCVHWSVYIGLCSLCGRVDKARVMCNRLGLVEEGGCVESVRAVVVTREVHWVPKLFRGARNSL
jgi:hypothetical protein